MTQKSNRRTTYTDRYGNLKRFGYGKDDRHPNPINVIQASYESYEHYKRIVTDVDKTSSKVL